MWQTNEFSLEGMKLGAKYDEKRQQIQGFIDTYHCQPQLFTNAVETQLSQGNECFCKEPPCMIEQSDMVDDSNGAMAMVGSTTVIQFTVNSASG